jgi:competence protein ComGC
MQGIKYCKRLPDDKLCDMLNLAKKLEWTIKMLEANQDAYDYDLHGLTEYLERLKTATSISAKHNSTTHDETSKASDKSRKRKKWQWQWQW